jgi:hypothetical protein
MTVHRLWVEVHYVFPIEWDSEHDDRAEAITEAQQDKGAVAELLPACMAVVVPFDAWLDVLDKTVDGIYQRLVDREAKVAATFQPGASS